MEVHHKYPITGQNLKNTYTSAGFSLLYCKRQSGFFSPLYDRQKENDSEEEHVTLEGAAWLVCSSWHDAPQSDKVLLPDFVGHTHAHIHMHTLTCTQAICYRHTGSARSRHLLHMTQRQKHIQIPCVVNMHDRVTYFQRDINFLLN